MISGDIGGKLRLEMSRVEKHDLEVGSRSFKREAEVYLPKFPHHRCRREDRKYYEG